MSHQDELVAALVAERTAHEATKDIVRAFQVAARTASPYVSRPNGAIRPKHLEQYISDLKCHSSRLLRENEQLRARLGGSR